MNNSDFREMLNLKTKVISILTLSLGQYAFVLIPLCHDTWVLIPFILQSNIIDYNNFLLLKEEGKAQNVSMLWI